MFIRIPVVAQISCKYKGNMDKNLMGSTAQEMVQVLVLRSCSALEASEAPPFASARKALLPTSLASGTGYRELDLAIV